MYRGRGCALLFVLVVLVEPVAAQVGWGALTLSATRPDGTSGAGVRVEVEATSGTPSPMAVSIGDAGSAARTPMPVGSYRLSVRQDGYHPADVIVYVPSGTVLHVGVRLAPLSSSVPTEMRVVERVGATYQAVFTPEQLRDLPTSRTAWSLLETAHGPSIADRMGHAGLWDGEPARLGSHGSSWTQTTFQFDGMDVTDARAGGMPVLYPGTGVMEAVDVRVAALPLDVGSPGAVVTMIPRPAGHEWSGAVDGSVSPAWQQGAPAAPGAPPIARLDAWSDGGLVAGGPVTGRVGVVASARFTRARRLERADLTPLPSEVASAHVRLSATPRDAEQVHVILALHDDRRPYAGRARFADRVLDEDARGLVVGANWERAGSSLWSVGGNYQRASISPDTVGSAAGGTVERLLDGPPLALVDGAESLGQRAAASVRIQPLTARAFGSDHDVRAGVSISRSSDRIQAVAQPAFAELVGGLPARVWDVGYRGPTSHRRVLEVEGFLSAQLHLSSGLTLGAGLRAEYAGGSAEGAPASIGWGHVTPRAQARWRPRPGRDMTFVIGYGWYRQRLPLSALAAGDPAGPSGIVYRWDDADGDRRHTPSELTALGPVGAGAPGTTIDPDLRRPSTREFHVGVEYGRGPWRLGITGMDRREDDLLALVNTGVTLEDYDVRYLDDPGADIAGRSGFQQLPVYSRQPASFGKDQYVLGHAAGEPSRYQGVDIALEGEFQSRWHLRFGGTAYRSEGVGASRGVGPDENDQGVRGEAFLTPNAATWARGRLFFDRAYVMKLSGGYRAPGEVRLGVAARYQDGQPFARVVLVDALGQGAEAIQAYPRGDQRFTYTLTLDLRAAREVRRGRYTVGFVVDVFNALNTDKEVEEDIVTGPAFRTVTAVQPPRVVRFGARVGF